MGETEAKGVWQLVAVVSVENECMGAPARRLSRPWPPRPLVQDPRRTFSSNFQAGCWALPGACTPQLPGTPPHFQVLQEPRCLTPVTLSSLGPSHPRSSSNICVCRTLQVLISDPEVLPTPNPGTRAFIQIMGQILFP